MNHRLCFSFVLSLLFTFQAEATSNPDINSYGQLPQVRSLKISPNGQYFSYIKRGKEHDQFSVIDTKTKKKIVGANVTKFKARSTAFITNNHILLRGSETSSTFGYRGRREHTGALVYNIKTQKFKLLLKNTKDLHPAQTGIGRIVGFNAEKETVYMPAFSTNSQYHLYKVNLDSGRGRIHAKGNHDTIDWFVNEQGKILGREEYDEDSQRHIIRSKLSGKWKIIYSNDAPMPEISVQAVGADGQSLLFIDANDDRGALYSIDLLSGEVSGPLFSEEDSDVDNLVVDINRKLNAVAYSGFKTQYDFVDPTFNELIDRIHHTFPASSVRFSSWSKDKKLIVTFVTGGDEPGTYYLFDTEKIKLSKLATQYDVTAIGEIKAIRYPARDGLKIPAILTLPPGDEKRKNLPLIAFPHGGPESYDQINFDWMAQYLAMKGYAVLQPNFRGSTGFGFTFRNAGRGRWGREMQDDVTDGLKTLVKAGYVDPKRVCIMGASYGGYSALAGGAFSPDLYRCIISVSGVSDLPKMLNSDKEKYGSDHWVISYWREVIGDSKADIDKLRTISPVNFASSFQAPVLLIHGKDDTVVPIDQSKRMYKALKKAKKPVEFTTLKGEDHWLSTSSTRLQMLKAISDFLDSHNPANTIDKEKNNTNQEVSALAPQ